MKATMSGVMFYVSLGVGLIPQAIMLAVMLLLAVGLFIRLDRESGVYTRIN